MDRREWLSDSQETFRQSFEGEQGKIWTALPAIVVSVDLAKQTISAQSGIKGERKLKDGTIEYLDISVFENVALCFPRAGGYAITFPVQIGDEVLIIFASRCIDEWWYSGGENNIAPEFRMHDLSDSFAILAPTSRPKQLDGVSTNSLRIMNEDSTKYIEISGDKISVQSDSEVEVIAETVTVDATSININSTSTVNITASNSISLTAPDIYFNGVTHP